MRKLKDGEEKLPKSVSHTTVVVLLGNQLLFVIIFEDCTVLLAGAGIWWDGGGGIGGELGPGDGLLFKVMSVFVMSVDTHPVLWSCLSS